LWRGEGSFIGRLQKGGLYLTRKGKNQIQEEKKRRSGGKNRRKSNDFFEKERRCRGGKGGKRETRRHLYQRKKVEFPKEGKGGDAPKREKLVRETFRGKRGLTPKKEEEKRKNPIAYPPRKTLGENQWGEGKKINSIPEGKN